MDSTDSGSLSSYSPFVDNCTVYVRDFGDGETELQVRRGFDLQMLSGVPGRSGHASAARRDPVPDPGPWDEAFDAEAYAAWRQARAVRDALDAENRDRSARRARQIACHRIKAIKADRLLTLTYRENMQDRATVAKHWKAFLRRIRRVQGFEYVATLERQKRGAWHIHVAIRGRQNYRLLRSVWLSVVGAGNGNIDVRNPWRERALRHRLAAYMSKYIGKGFDASSSGVRRVWVSEGIELPERQVIGFPFVGWTDAIHRALQLMPAVDGDPEWVGWYASRRTLFQLVTSTRT